MSRDTYIIAVKRESRGLEPADWKELIGRESGIEILPSTGLRLRVRASANAVACLRAKWKNILHIEKQIVHEPQSV